MKGRDVSLAIFAAGAVVALAAAYASGHPDGLEWVAKGLGFAQGAEGASVDNSFLSTFIAGVIGVAGVFIVAMLIGRVIQAQLKLRKRGAR